MRESRQRGIPFALALVLATPLPARSQQPPAATVSQQPAVVPATPADARRVLADIITRYYDAIARKDLPAVEALWHPKGPARRARNILEVEFERRSTRLVFLDTREVKVDAGGARARVLADLEVTDVQTRQTRREHRVREFTFLQDGDTWKIWNEGSFAPRDLASRLLDATAAEATALIASDPEIRTEDTLTALGQQANWLRAQGNLAKALDALRVHAELARVLGNERVLAGTLMDAGLVYQVVGRQEEAGRAFTEARALFARFGTRSELAIVDGNLASVDYLQGNYPAAAERYRAALAAFDAERDAPHAATTLHSLGNALYMQGEFEQAMASYERSLKMQETGSWTGDGVPAGRAGGGGSGAGIPAGQAVANPIGASSVLQAIALVHKELGNYSAAADAFARSGVLSTGAADWVGAARAEHGLGDVNRLAGDYPTALQHFNAALALWAKTADPSNLAATRFAAGQVCVLQRAFSRGVTWYQAALQLDETQGDQAGIARDLGGLGGAHLAMGQLALALEEYKRSLSIRESLKDVPGTMWTVVHIGILYAALNRHGEALEAYQRALTIAEAQGDAGATSTVLALRAANELARDDLEAALASSAKAAEMARRLDLFDVVAAAEVTSGKALRTAGRVAEARAAFENAIASVERVPVGPGVETFFDDRRGPYLALIDLLVSEKLPNEALRWSERARTNALATLLGGDGAVVVKGLAADEQDEERRLSRAAKTLAVKVRRERGRAKPDPDRFAALQRDLLGAQDKLSVFRQALFERHPLLRALRVQDEAASLDTARAVLAPSEALVSFVVSEAKTFVVVVARPAQGAPQASTATIEVKAADLAARVATLREAVRGRRADAARLGRDLHELLLAPVRESLATARSLVILPDAFLWSLPFEVLQNGAGRYLVQDFALSYAPSLTGLATMRTPIQNAPAGVSRAERAPTGRAPARPLLVVAAAPVIARSAEERLALVSPSGTSSSSSDVREARALSLLFGPSASRVLVREQASTDRIGAALKPSGVLHLAVPGYLTDASPLYSLVALSANGERDQAQGLLDPVDMMSWSLPGDLVVLSRLEHAEGTPTGESLVALGWALFLAGTPEMVVNRWLPPAGASKSMTAFYRAWLAAEPGARRSAAAAMQKAARSLLAQPGSHPADWAGLMVLGR